MGHRLSPSTLSDWFSWAEGSYIVESCHIHTESRKRIEQNYRKLYATDWALANAVSTWTDERLPHSLECLVYWQLRRAGFEVT
jgi:predicted AAA+ superfamily ATPase